MNKREIRKRIEILKRISLDLDLLTDDRDEEELLAELEGLIDEVRYFYVEKLDELEQSKNEFVYEYNRFSQVVG